MALSLRREEDNKAWDVISGGGEPRDSAVQTQRRRGSSREGWLSKTLLFVAAPATRDTFALELLGC